MSNSYDNLVGKIVLKDIYIIKNKINDMVYIGQAIDTYRRWKGHKTAAKTGHYKNKSVLYEAMHKYGIDNFYYEILEKQIPNYNEREKYWIQFYNCIVPNGYNILDGGEQYPNLKGIQNPSSAIKSQDILNSVIFDLSNTDMLLTEIAIKYNIPINTIHGINSGDTYFVPNISYPIRTENKHCKIGYDSIDELKYDLFQNKMTTKEISLKYGVSETTIRNINNGVIYKDTFYTYPIRAKSVLKSNILTDNEIKEIINLIQNTSLSYREIARRYNVQHNTIINIKNGSNKYRRENLKYPLRPNN